MVELAQEPRSGRDCVEVVGSFLKLSTAGSSRSMMGLQLRLERVLPLWDLRTSFASLSKRSERHEPTL